MITQERTATLSRALLPEPSIITYAGLALLLGLLAAAFEALFPHVLLSGKSLLLVERAKGRREESGHRSGHWSWVGVCRARGERTRWLYFWPCGDVYCGSHRVLSMDGAPGRRRSRIIAFSFLITLFARISIHFGDNLVPITGQTLAVLLTGAVLGARLGMLATLMYLVQGMAGMHVYAGGSFGLVWQLSSGGYIIGFVAAAFLVGFMVEQGWNKGAPLLVAMLLGNVLLYVPGLLQLGFFVEWKNVLPWGLYPFIPGDLAKLYVASLLVPAGSWALLRYRLGERPAWT